MGTMHGKPAALLCHQHGLACLAQHTQTFVNYGRGIVEREVQSRERVCQVERRKTPQVTVVAGRRRGLCLPAQHPCRFQHAVVVAVRCGGYNMSIAVYHDSRHHDMMDRAYTYGKKKGSIGKLIMAFTTSETSLIRSALDVR